MNSDQRRAQVQAVIAQYKKMVSGGALAQLADDIDQSRYLWASEVLCRLVSTLKTIHDFELNVLRDTLNGKVTKIHARLRDVLSQSKSSPDNYANWMMHNAEGFGRYREPAKTYTVETIPLIEAFRMLKQEEARSPEYRKKDWKQNRGAVRTSPEQRLLWG